MTAQHEPAPALALMEEYRAALSQGWAPYDLARAEHLYVHDETFTAYDIAPPTAGYFGWDSYAAAWYKILENYASFEMYWNDDIRWGQRGEVLWTSASFKCLIRANRDDEPFEKEGRVSLVWLHEGDRWVITHEHVSVARPNS